MSFIMDVDKSAFTMPITIMVSFIILLAVGSIVLITMQSSIKELSTGVIELKSLNDASAECNLLCSTARSNNCEDENMVRYCIKRFKIDLNNDGKFTDYTLGPYKVCEENIFCPMISDCVCGGYELNLGNCLKFVKDYYDKMDIDSYVFSNIFSYSIDEDNTLCTDDENSWVVLFENYFD